MGYAAPDGRRLALKRSYLEPDGSLPAPLVRELAAFSALADSGPGKRARTEVTRRLAVARTSPADEGAKENAAEGVANGGIAEAAARKGEEVGPAREGATKRAGRGPVGGGAAQEDGSAAVAAPVGAGNASAVAVPVGAGNASGTEAVCDAANVAKPAASGSPPLRPSPSSSPSSARSGSASPELGEPLSLFPTCEFPFAPPLGLVREKYAVALALPLARTDLGSALRARRRRGLPPPEPAATRGLARALLRALAACAAAGVAHRDVAPGNLLIWSDGRVALGDFGSAQVADAAEAGTRRGRGEAKAEPGGAAEVGPGGAVAPSPPPGLRAMLCTTPPFATRWYAAPELLLGAKRYLALPADLWAAGALLCELAVGVPPFRASTDLGIVGALVSGVGLPPPREVWPTREKDCPDLANLRLERLAVRDEEEEREEEREAREAREAAPGSAKAEERAVEELERGEGAGAGIPAAAPDGRRLRRLRRHLEHVANNPPPPNEAPAVRVADTRLLELALRLMAYDPRERPSAEEALRDAYFGARGDRGTQGARAGDRDAQGELDPAMRDAEAVEREAIAAFLREAFPKDV